MTKISIEEAQAKLQKLIHELLPGEEVIITEDNHAVARLISARPSTKAGLFTWNLRPTRSQPLIRQGPK